MDPLTHILFNAALARSEIIPDSRQVQAVMILAGIVPDLDLVWHSRGIPEYFIHHRRESHSLPGLALLSLPLLALAKYLSPGLNWPLLYGCVWAGMLGHIFLDFLTVYGVPLLFPWKKRYFNFGILFILDPWLNLILLPPVLEKFVPWTGPSPARISLLLVGSYFALLAILKSISQSRGPKRISEKFPGLGQAQVYSSPFLALPFSWLILLKHEQTIYRMRYSLLFGPGPIVAFSGQDPDLLRGYIQKSPLLRALIEFSNFLHWQIQPTASGKKIIATDLRFSQYNPGFRAEAEFDSEEKLRASKFYFY